MDRPALTKIGLWFLFFILLCAFYWTTYYLPQNSNQITGDGMCNIAYWYSFFDPSLRGSIGASVTKPGWAVMLGLSHDFYNRFGHSNAMLKSVLVFSISLLVWSLVRVAWQIGGPYAGASSFFLALFSYPIFYWYKGAHSILFCAPLVLLGLRLYSSGREKAGASLLLAGIFFRVEAALVPIFVCAFHLIKKEYRKCLILVLFVAVALSLWAAFVYHVQGSFLRLDAGLGVGYNAISKEYNFLSLHNSWRSFASAWRTYFQAERHMLALCVLGAMVALAARGARIYLCLAGLFLGQFLNILLLGGSSHYVIFVEPFAIALGSGGIFYFLKQLKCRPLLVNTAKALVCIAIITALFSKKQVYLKKYYFDIRNVPLEELTEPAPFLTNALDIVKRGLLPRGSRVLTEDDVAYSLVINSPKRHFKALYALPYFNLCREEKQRAILGNTDFIYISKLWHQTFFLASPSSVVWKDDAFRRAILRLKDTGEPVDIHGARLELLDESDCGILIKAKDCR